MKTNYIAPADQVFLEKILRMALMSTEILYNFCDTSLPISDYVKDVVSTREKIFEYLGEEDPNPRYDELLGKTVEAKQSDDPSLVTIEDTPVYGKSPVSFLYDADNVGKI